MKQAVETLRYRREALYDIADLQRTAIRSPSPEETSGDAAGITEPSGSV